MKTKQFTVGDIRKATDGLSDDAHVNLTDTDFCEVIDANFHAASWEERPGGDKELSDIDTHNGQLWINVRFTLGDGSEAPQSSW